MLMLWTGVIVLLLRKVHKSQVNIQFSSSLHILWSSLLLRLCILVCCAEFSIQGQGLWLAAWPVRHWPVSVSKFVHFGWNVFSVSPQQLKHLSLRKEVVSGHPGNLGLVGGSGFLTFFCCGSGYMESVVWQWLVLLCPLNSVWGFMTGIVYFYSLEFFNKSLGRPSSKFWRRGVCIVLTPWRPWTACVGRKLFSWLFCLWACRAPKTGSAALLMLQCWK